jgi:probable rRNA maturation factor
MIHIEIAESMLDAYPGIDLETDLVEQAACETLEYEHASPDSDITIVLTGDAELQALNQQFRAMDEPTDVLSFPAGFVDPDTTHTYLGDIVISVERARAQAEMGGHALQAELTLLVVHGALHLLGYDHETDEDKTEMWAVQAGILQRLNCPLSPP